MWNLKGRQASAVIDPAQRMRVLNSSTMIPYLNKPLLWTLETLVHVEYVAGLSGPQLKPEPFVCLVMRLLQICPHPSIIFAALQQDVHKYLRAAALFVVRLLGNHEMMQAAMAVGFDDYRNVRIYGTQREKRWFMDRRSLLEAPEGEANECSSATAAASLSKPLRPSKRPRESDVEGGAGEARALGNNQEESRKADECHSVEDVSLDLWSGASMQDEMPVYFIVHMDELTDRLFTPTENTPGVPNPRTTSDDKSSVAPHDMRTFLGILLPPLYNI